MHLKVVIEIKVMLNTAIFSIMDFCGSGKTNGVSNVLIIARLGAQM